jgi:hypothetical protein
MAQNKCTCGNELPDNPDGIQEPMSGEPFFLCGECSGKAFLPNKKSEYTIEHEDGKQQYYDSVRVSSPSHTVRIDHNHRGSTIFEIKGDDIELFLPMSNIEIDDSENSRMLITTEKDQSITISEDELRAAMTYKHGGELYEMVALAILNHNNLSVSVNTVCDNCHRSKYRTEMADDEICQECNRADSEVEA